MSLPDVHVRLQLRGYPSWHRSAEKDIGGDQRPAQSDGKS
jgi:hypothetical protein